jgi:hypothetical protein
VAGFGHLEDGLRQAGDWYRWGPYVSERQWGTVREDYSPNGQSWDYLPHDHARSRAYRWGEDGLAGFCDIEQRLCLVLALWNGRDPILKERAFGLTGEQGNHGEDVKEYWWYLDALPSHAWNRWRYHYPQQAFPYTDLVAVNGRRDRTEPEYELMDTGVFDDDRYWIVEVHYVKADPDDILMAIEVTNAGPDAATLHVLPTAWFRNTWSWEIGAPKPLLAAAGDGAVSIRHPFGGELELLASTGPDGAAPVPGPLDRSHLPVGGTLEQSDATGWMAFYAMAMGSIAVALGRANQRPGTDLVLKFLEHFAGIRDAIDSQGLWDDQDGMYYDRLLTPSGTAVSVKVRSMVGMIPLLAVGVVDESMLRLSLAVGKQFASLLGARGLADPAKLAEAGLLRGTPGDRRLLLSVAGPDRLPRLLTRLFDEGEFLSPHGLRSLSAYHREHPYQLDVEGVRATIDYEPAESTTPMFGGNSNWRGPVWFPLNYLVISMLERYQRFFGNDLTIEYPAGSGRPLALGMVTADLRDRLISLFVAGPDGRRPCFGGVTRLQDDPAWRDNLVFSEYFHGDNGAGLGASHQTGWTGLIADVIRRRHGALPSVGEVLADMGTSARSG